MAKGHVIIPSMKIGYARVSTDEQHLDLQRDALLAAGCTTICQDEGISGITQDRPGLTQALAGARRQRYAGGLETGPLGALARVPVSAD